jgi:hypothetical protein
VAIVTGPTSTAAIQNVATIAAAVFGMAAIYKFLIAVIIRSNIVADFVY